MRQSIDNLYRLIFLKNDYIGEVEILLERFPLNQVTNFLLPIGGERAHRLRKYKPKKVKLFVGLSLLFPYHIVRLMEAVAYVVFLACSHILLIMSRKFNKV